MTVLQTHLPHAPWADPRTARLPGVQPMDPSDWLRVDDAYSGQMALRDTAIAERPALVHAMLPTARAAADELYARVMHDLPGLGFRVSGSEVLRPDGVTVPLDPAEPLLTLGRLVQEDLCILQPEADEHVLSAAILCFPAGWTLAQKIGRPLTGIHKPVAPYDDRIAASVQRMFNAIRVEQPLWRANALLYDDPTLFQPRREGESRPSQGKPLMERFLRSERQCLLRLPETRAVIFSIHTYVVPVAALTDAQQVGLDAAH